MLTFVKNNFLLNVHFKEYEVLASSHSYVTARSGLEVSTSPHCPYFLEKSRIYKDTLSPVLAGPKYSTPVGNQTKNLLVNRQVQYHYTTTL